MGKKTWVRVGDRPLGLDAGQRVVGAEVPGEEDDVVLHRTEQFRLELSSRPRPRVLWRDVVRGDQRVGHLAGAGRASREVTLDRVRVVRMGIPDRLITHGDPKLLLAKYGLDADGIYTRVKESIEVLDERRAKPQRVVS